MEPSLLRGFLSRSCSMNDLVTGEKDDGMGGLLDRIRLKSPTNTSRYTLLCKKWKILSSVRKDLGNGVGRLKWQLVYNMYSSRFKDSKLVIIFSANCERKKRASLIAAPTNLPLQISPSVAGALSPLYTGDTDPAAVDYMWSAWAEIARRR